MSLTAPLGLVHAPVRTIQVRIPIRAEVPPRSMYSKAKGTRRVPLAESSPSPLSLPHSATTTYSTTPPQTSTRSSTVTSLFQTVTGVRPCALLYLFLQLALAHRFEYRQQSVSALTNVPDNMFEGSGQVFTKFGFEYWAEPSSPENGFITWVANGIPSHRVAAAAVGPDQGPGGTGVGRRLIPEEPMVGFEVAR